MLRARDFDAMLCRHPHERGLCIDHWAALSIDGDSFSVLSLPNKEGSVSAEGTFLEDRSGVPGVWSKWVQDGQVSASPYTLHPTPYTLQPTR